MDGMNHEEKSKLSKQRTTLRKALHVAIAAIPLVSSDAIAAGPKFPTVPNTTRAADVKASQDKKNLEAPRLKKLPERARRPKALIPSSVDTEFINGYLLKIKEARGAQLVLSGRAVHFPQYEDFCNELSMFCQRYESYRADAEYHRVFSPEQFAQITTINREVNKKIAPKEDILQYGVEELWTIPDDAGDCEDYVLLKMIRFVDAGFAPTALHILVVRDQKDQGHAVLGIDVFVNGTRNTLVLDNKTDDIITLDAMEKNYKGKLASSLVLSHDGKPRVTFFEYKSNTKNRTDTRDWKVDVFESR